MSILNTEIEHEFSSVIIHHISHTHRAMQNLAIKTTEPRGRNGSRHTVLKKHISDMLKKKDRNLIKTAHFMHV